MAIYCLQHRTDKEYHHETRTDHPGHFRHRQMLPDGGPPHHLGSRHRVCCPPHHGPLDPHGLRRVHLPRPHGGHARHRGPLGRPRHGVLLHLHRLPRQHPPGGARRERHRPVPEGRHPGRRRPRHGGQRKTLRGLCPRIRRGDERPLRQSGRRRPEHHGSVVLTGRGVHRRRVSGRVCEAAPERARRPRSPLRGPHRRVLRRR